MRIFFDASVIISALLLPNGGSSQLFKLLKKGEIKGITSQTVINEVLEEQKKGTLKKTRGEIENFIADSGIMVREAISLQEIEFYQDRREIENAHLIAGANLTKCEYLVSLDRKHLVREDVKREFLHLRIVTPKEIIAKLI